MNRCAQVFVWGALLLASSLVVAQVPQRTPPIPAAAERGWLEILESPLVLLDRRPARLAPGARLRGSDNLVQMPAALSGKVWLVRYVRDAQGQIQEAWILTEAEALAGGVN